MAEINLLPRLNPLAVHQALLLAKTKGWNSVWPDLNEIRAKCSFSASGGNVLQPEDFSNLKKQIVEVAENLGFPDDRGNNKQRAAFDQAVAIILTETPLITFPEVLRDDFWSFVATALMPEIVQWRFDSPPEERFYGGIRNTFQRLWMRANILDRGAEHEDRWGLLRELTEDALVQITERPSIGGESRLARTIAEVWVKTSNQAPDKNMEKIMREAIVDLRIRFQIQHLVFLSDENLQHEVQKSFSKFIGD